MVYCWPSAWGYIGLGGSEPERWGEKWSFTVFQALLATALPFVPHTSPARRFQYQPCPTRKSSSFKTGLESAPFSTSTSPMLSQAAIPSYLAHLAHHTSLLPTSTLQYIFHTDLLLFPTPTPIPWAPTHWPPHCSSDLPGTSCPQGLCITLALLFVWNTLPPDIHMEASSLSTHLCSVSSKEAFPDSLSHIGAPSPMAYPALCFCTTPDIVNIYICLFVVCLPTPKCRLRERQYSVSFSSTKNNAHYRCSKIFVKINFVLRNCHRPQEVKATR